MDKITGNGRPTKHTKGEVGQWYEDLETGDIWECRIAHEYSAIHGYPVGGYVWELRATGEDMREIYGGGSTDTNGKNDEIEFMQFNGMIPSVEIGDCNTPLVNLTADNTVLGTGCYYTTEKLHNVTDFSAGKVYVVIFDGEKYICPVDITSYGSGGLGTESIAELDEFKYPFYIHNNGTLVKTAPPHTLEIYECTAVNKIDNFFTNDEPKMIRFTLNNYSYLAAATEGNDIGVTEVNGLTPAEVVDIIDRFKSNKYPYLVPISVCESGSGMDHYAIGVSKASGNSDLFARFEILCKNNATGANKGLIHIVFDYKTEGYLTCVSRYKYTADE